MVEAKETLPIPGPAARKDDEEIILQLAAGHVNELFRAQPTAADPHDQPAPSKPEADLRRVAWPPRRLGWPCLGAGEGLSMATQTRLRQGYAGQATRGHATPRPRRAGRTARPARSKRANVMKQLAVVLAGAAVSGVLAWLLLR